MACSSFFQLSSFVAPIKPPLSKFPQFLPLSSSSTTAAPQYPSLSFSPPKASGGRSEWSADDVAATTACPSLPYANIMYYDSGYNVQIAVEEDEPEERLLNRFRREVMRAGIIQECKRRRFFENKQDKRKRKTREAAKRNSRRRRPPISRGGATQVKPETSKTDQYDEDEDNWEMPEGDGLPL